jgi:nucleoside-diphosphate-sugar epimerase
MRVFVAGGTGAIGRELVPLLVESGHEVIALARTPEKGEQLRAAGAGTAIGDALDPASVEEAVCGASPEVVVHQLTAIPAAIDPRAFADAFAPTNRLRREGTRNLVSAARAAGARRVIAQSIAQAYAPEGGWVKQEEDPLYAGAPDVFRDVFDAVIELERTVLDATDLEPVVMRYGNFYGPGTAYAADGANAQLVRGGTYPVAGDGPAHWSFIHVADAARATLAAIERGEPGIYNVTDDEPAAVRDWLPAFAAALGAPDPPRTPAPRGDYGAFGMLHARGASNAKARAGLGWTPELSSWREGFAASLA